MPPWFAVPGYGEFQNQRLLTVEEIKTLGDWSDAGAPRGDESNVPSGPEPDRAWAYGPPDLILTPDEPYSVAASGGEDVRCFVMPSGLREPKAVRAMDVRSAEPGVVYHVRAFADVTGVARRLNVENRRLGFDCSSNMRSLLTLTPLGEWEAGLPFPALPTGSGRYLPKAADVVIEVHYHRNYKKGSDRTSVAFYFQREPIDHYLQTARIVNRQIRVPAGEPDYHATAVWAADRDIVALAVSPHMHLLGTSVRITASLPGGAARDLVWVNRYDFRWQTSYVFQEPIPMPKGTTITAEAHFDNTYQNLNLHHAVPLRDAKWGTNLEDEMLAVFLDYIDAKSPRKSSSIPAVRR
jgi:hypothetical protein